MRNFIFIVFSLLFCAALRAENAAALFAQANAAYQKNDFSTAILKYEKLVAQKNNSAMIYYDLGNAYFKSGNLAQAILNYERAERLDKFDEDIHHNLEYARKKTVDQMESQPIISEKVFGVLSAFSWKILALALVWFGFAGFVLFLFVPNLKNTGAYLGVTFLLFAGITFWFGKEQGSYELKCHFRIVTNAEAYVKSSPDDSSTDLFLLHEGAKVQVFDEVGNYQKIRIADGRVGWVLKSESTKI
ncbi:MAG TPA: tetratricopeptide repeat protein [Chitinophagales bacterium]